MSGFALGGVFCLMVNLLINPQNVRATINYLGDGDFIYPYYITNKVLFFQLIFLGVIIVLCTASVLCICDYDKESILREEEEEDNEKKNIVIAYPIDVSNMSSDMQKSRLLIKPVKVEEVDHADSFYKETICSLCISLKSYAFLILIVLTSITPLLAVFTYYEFGRHYEIGESVLRWCSFGFVFMCGIGRLILGALYNSYKNYKVFMYVILGLQGLLGGLFYHSSYLSVGFCIVVILIGFTYGGLTILIPLYLYHIYGYELYGKMYSILSLGEAAISILIVPFMKVLSKGIADYGMVHLVLYLIGAACNLIAVLLVYCTSDYKFNSQSIEK